MAITPTEEEIEAAQQLFYIYNVEGVSELTASDELCCSDYFYCE